MTSPAHATDGDYIAPIISEVWPPTASDDVTASLIGFRCDNNETVAVETAKGKMVFVFNAG